MWLINHLIKLHSLRKQNTLITLLYQLRAKCILETGDTAIVIFQTLLGADKNEAGYSINRRATYVFKKEKNGMKYIEFIVEKMEIIITIFRVHNIFNR